MIHVPGIFEASEVKKKQDKAKITLWKKQEGRI